ncbi:hypothetical protein RLIN73S_01592 [Rhodanobacter lindaniclasticus]
MSGYGAARSAGNPPAVSPQRRCASLSLLIGGSRTAASRKLTKKLVRCASSESFSQVLRACTAANGPAGCMHHHPAATPNAMPAPRTSSARRGRHPPSRRQSQRQVR